MRITPEATENPEEANLVIDVKEKNTGEFNFGVGVSSVDSVMGNVRLTQRNFDYKDWPKSWRDLISGNAFVGAGQTLQRSTPPAAPRRRTTACRSSSRGPSTGPSAWAARLPHRGQHLLRFQRDQHGLLRDRRQRLWGPRWDGDVTYRFSYTEITNTDTAAPPILRAADRRPLPQPGHAAAGLRQPRFEPAAQPRVADGSVAWNWAAVRSWATSTGSVRRSMCPAT